MRRAIAFLTAYLVILPALSARAAVPASLPPAAPRTQSSLQPPMQPSKQPSIPTMMQSVRASAPTGWAPAAGFDLMPASSSSPSRLALEPRGVGSPLQTQRDHHSWRQASFSYGWEHRSGSVTVPLAISSVVLIPLDASLHRYTARHWRGTVEDQLGSAGNEAGSVGGIVAVGATYLIGTAHERDTAMMAASAALESGLVTEALKFAVGRRRPSGGDAPSFSPFHGGASFPSGHATFSFSLATVYAHR
ncbi:MAG: hypothetical protein LC772_01405 [Chloroflexi bacterium]|nr:hypothetical protein [Chloroflexota bacterium]